jgi:hypothetical protein
LGGSSAAHYSCLPRRAGWRSINPILIGPKFIPNADTTKFQPHAIEIVGTHDDEEVPGRGKPESMPFRSELFLSAQIADFPNGSMQKVCSSLLLYGRALSYQM